jgi:transposase InsO family protein
MGKHNQPQAPKENPQVKLHRNARLTPAGRRLLVHRVRVLGWTVTRAAQASGVSRRTGTKWVGRFDAAGDEGLEDRSSRPRRVARQTAASLVRQIERLRRQRKTAWEIARELRVPASTVSKLLRERGLGRLWRVEEAITPPQRYEHAAPGGMFHIDAKKLGRVQGLGHRVHGDRRRRHRGAGWEAVFVCVDDHTRLAYAEVLSAENADNATAFLGRALRRFEDQGIRCQRVLTDNARCYGSHAFEDLCAQRGVRHLFTKPYTPRTNGKAERFIQTLIRRWAYRWPYRTSAIRTAALRPWLHEYNHRRPHRALGMKPPIARLRATREQRA